MNDKKKLRESEETREIKAGVRNEIEHQPLSAILDSSLISATLKKEYQIKLVKCGSYCQVYFYKESMVRKKEKKDFDELSLNKIDISESIEERKNVKSTLHEIEFKNITRSKLECQRIAKANMEVWKTFITLTFKENIECVPLAHKRFKLFVDKIRRIKPDFMYLAIPEFQKRGAIHYHLLTNIDITDTKLIYAQEDNNKYLHVKYWLDGFDSVEPLNSEPKKVVGYISKYMTKSIDNRLFGHRRYFNSQNLKKPITSYIDINNEKELEFYKKNIQDTTLIYQNEYENPYDKTKVQYLEYSSK